MVWVTEPWDDATESDNGSCFLSWRVLPLLILEGLLIAIVCWRIAHQVYWKSHPRRIFFHLVLLTSCVFRVVFWCALCAPTKLFGIGLALLWWSNSLLLLCTASIIVQWWCAVSAGRVAVREFQKAKQFSLHHPLVVLHIVHLLCASLVCVFAIQNGLHNASEMETYLSKKTHFLFVFRSINITTVGIDAIVAVVVATKLRERLLQAAMAEDMKKKSVIQMTLLIICITTGLLLQLVMDVPILVTTFQKGFGTKMRFSLFCVVQFFLPSVLLSLSFLYIMRRVEQREPVRLVVMPTASSLVDYEECASPCMWCHHHRQYNVGGNKWDVNLMTSISPRTVDSSFRSMNHHHHHHQGGGGGHAHGPHPHHPHHQHHTNGSSQSVAVLGRGGTFPSDLETPIAWPSSPIVPPQVPTPVRTTSGRRMVNTSTTAGGGGGPQEHRHHQRRHHRHQHRGDRSHDGGGGGGATVVL